MIYENIPADLRVGKHRELPADLRSARRKEFPEGPQREGYPSYIPELPVDLRPDWVRVRFPLRVR